MLTALYVVYDIMVRNLCRKPCWSLIDFFFSSTSTTTDSIISKSLLKCIFVSKSWHQLISSPDFVNTHLKLNFNHRVVFPGINGNFNFSFLLRPLFNKQQGTVHMDPLTLSISVVGSASGLICLCDHKGNIYIYDDSRDYYKALFIDYCVDKSTFFFSPTWVMMINIYSLRTDSWKTLYDQF